MTRIGEKIKSARMSKGWNQSDLAEKMGVEPPTISRWESGENTPRPKQLVALGKLLEKPTSWFVTESEGLEDRLASLELRLRQITANDPSVNSITTSYESLLHEKLFSIARQLPAEIIAKYIPVFTDELQDLASTNPRKA